MPSPLEELRNKKIKEKELNAKQEVSSMIDVYSPNKIAFVEKLFDSLAGACPNYRHNAGEGDFPCRLSNAYSNDASEYCKRYWVDIDDLLRGIISLCDAPLTEKSETSALGLFKAMYADGFFIEKTCKRLAKGGPIAWVFEDAKEIQHWYFNIDKIGN